MSTALISTAQRPFPRLGFIDGIRAISAIYIAMQHAVLQIWPLDRPPTGYLLWAIQPFLIGHLFVSIFIVVSGFCLMVHVIRHEWQVGGYVRFLKRRSWRILPPYYAALALSLLLICTIIGEPTGTHWDQSTVITPVGLIAHLLMLQDIIGYYQINHAMWSLAVEWHLYLLFPLIVFLWNKIGWKSAVISMVTLGCILSALVSGTFLEITTPYFLSLFVLGMLAAAITHGKEAEWINIRVSMPWNKIVAILSIALVFFGALMKLGIIGKQLMLFELLLNCLVCVFLITMKPAGLLKRILETPILVWIGTFSYSLYLIHAPLLQVFWQYVLFPFHMHPAIQCMLLIVVGIPMIILVAYGFFLVFERPFIRSRSAASHAAP